MSRCQVSVELRSGIITLVVQGKQNEVVLPLQESDSRHLMRELLEAVSAKAAESPPYQHAPRSGMEVTDEFANAYGPWTAEDDALLLLERAKGHGIAHLSRTLKRQPGAIQSRLKKLGDPSRS